LVNLDTEQELIETEELEEVQRASLDEAQVIRFKSSLVYLIYYIYFSTKSGHSFIGQKVLNGQSYPLNVFLTKIYYAIRNKSAQLSMEKKAF